MKNKKNKFTILNEFEDRQQSLKQFILNDFKNLNDSEKDYFYKQADRFFTQLINQYNYFVSRNDEDYINAYEYLRIEYKYLINSINK